MNPLISRLAQSVFAIWGIVTICFVFTRVLGDPAVMLLPMGTPPQQINELRESLGLNNPLWLQYVQFLLGAIRGDFGNSYQYFRPAMEVVLERMPATMVLALGAVVIGGALGLLGGFLASMYRGRIQEVAIMFVTLLGQATPGFWLGIVLIMIFAVELRWLPTGGFQSWTGAVLPIATLSLFVAANICRLFRAGMIEALSSDYIRTARAKGLPPSRIYRRHAAKNAVLPTMTVLALLMADLLGGSAVTETVFSWPGIGTLVVQALASNDYPLIQAAVFLIATIYVLINLLVDLAYQWVDPRIRRAR